MTSARWVPPMPASQSAAPSGVRSGAEAAVQLFDAPRVVVYCNETGCGSSQAVAEKLRSLQLVERVDVLYGGWKALRAAAKTAGVAVVSIAVHSRARTNGWARILLFLSGCDLELAFRSVEPVLARREPPRSARHS